jgi:hypothetical protein
MSPAPKYRARTCNTEVETKGVGDGQSGSDAMPLFSKVEKRIEGTGMANEADVFVTGFSGRAWRGEC